MSNSCISLYPFQPRGGFSPATYCSSLNSFRLCSFFNASIKFRSVDDRIHSSAKKLLCHLPLRYWFSADPGVLQCTRSKAKLEKWHPFAALSNCLQSNSRDRAFWVHCPCNI